MHDDLLRLIFTCCHPALAPAAQVALTLRLVGGLTTPEIARAFLVPEPTMAQRLVRAKGKIRDAKIPYRIPRRRRPRGPPPRGARGRLPGLQRRVRVERRGAARPRRSLRRGHSPRPPSRRADAAASPRSWACSPSCCSSSRAALRARTRTARSCDSPTRIADRWDRALIAEGHGPRPASACGATSPGPTRSRRRSRPCTATRRAPADTDWSQILQLYDQLMAIAPTPVVALNRAVAVAEVQGPAAALALVEGLDLDGYYLLHSIRADLLRRLGRNAEAALAYEAAIARTDNAAERELLRRRRFGALARRLNAALIGDPRASRSPSAAAPSDRGPRRRAR